MKFDEALDVADQVRVGELGALRRCRSSPTCRGSPRCRPRSRSATSAVVGVSPDQLLELARLDQDHSAPASSAPVCAASPKSCQAKSSFAPESDEVEADLAPLQQHVHRHDDRRRAAARRSRQAAKYGTFGSMIPTRSPASTPCSRSRFAIRAAAHVELRVGELDVVELDRDAVAVLLAPSRTRFSARFIRLLSRPDAASLCRRV